MAQALAEGSRLHLDLVFQGSPTPRGEHGGCQEAKDMVAEQRSYSSATCRCLDGGTGGIQGSLGRANPWCHLWGAAAG